jgi:cytochrome c-type biogenesis protein CcmF
LAPGLLLAGAGTILAAALGVAQFIYLAMIFAAGFALVSNLLVIFQKPERVGWRIGGFLTHMGFGLLLIGVVASSGFSETDRINLLSGAGPVSALGYQISYHGMEGSINDKDNAVLLEVRKGGAGFAADPKFFIAGENQGLMRKPYIRRRLFYDLYLSPQNRQTAGDGDRLILAKGEQDTVGNLAVKFVDFDMDSHGQPGNMTVGAVLEVARDSVTEIVTPYLAFTGGGKRLTEADLPGGAGSVVLDDIQADAKMVALRFTGVEGMEVSDLLILEVSKKPLINLVWLGIILICVGSFIAFVRRRRLQLR